MWILIYIYIYIYECSGWYNQVPVSATVYGRVMADLLMASGVAHCRKTTLAFARRVSLSWLSFASLLSS